MNDMPHNDAAVSYIVGIRAGCRAVGWPFGRLRVSKEGLEVCSLQGRWIKPRVAPLASIKPLRPRAGCA